MIRRLSGKIKHYWKKEGTLAVLSKGAWYGYRNLLGGIGYAYRSLIRSALPSVGHVRRGGIPVGTQEEKVGDKHLPKSFSPPYVGGPRPEYESGIRTGLRKYVEPGNIIVIVGGGLGVAATAAAKRCGRDGKVVVFEGSEQMRNITRSTLLLNGVRNRVALRNAVVEKKVSVWEGTNQTSESILRAKNLPKCDVLVLDCEGAETAILKKMAISPRIILVESHGVHGAPTSKVKDILKEANYEICSVELADRGQEDFCVEKDIMVISAVRIGG